MQWIDFPPLAEFSDRHDIVRSIRGTTIIGRYEFSDRMVQIDDILENSAPGLPWGEVYRSSNRLRHAIAKALDCWGIDVEWLTLSQIEQLLFSRGEEVGWLIELSRPKTPVPDNASATTLADALAVISTHCQSLAEALDLANTMPADLLQETLSAKANLAQPEVGKPSPKEQAKQDYIKQNFDKLMEMT